MLLGTYGAADVFIPALNMIIQVDGQHHDGPTRLAIDARFDAEAHKQGRALLRLHHEDTMAFHRMIPEVVMRCIEWCQPNHVTPDGQWEPMGLAMYTSTYQQLPEAKPPGSVTIED